jgi:cytoskeletal protein RodZ
MKIRKKEKAAKAVLIIALVVAFVVAGGAGYWYLDTNGFFGRKDKETQKQSDENNKTDNSTDNNSPSDEDNTGNNAKNEEEKPTTPTDEQGKKIAQIVVVDASQYDDVFSVRAGVTNLTEEGGNCEFVFTKGQQTLTRASEGIFTGTSVNCQSIEIPIKDFPAKGEWQMVVKYTSNAATGSSNIKTVMVK